MRLIDKALDFVFPPVCGFCGKIEKTFLCNECKERLELNVNYRINKYVDKSFNEHYWLFKYRDEIRNLFLKYKFNEKAYLYKSITALILSNEKAIEYLNRADYIIPVPIHRKRLKERGYNQCELIAEEISKKTKVKYLPNVLLKNKNTVPQSTLNQVGRCENIKGAFSINKDVNLVNKNIILFDDIYTTGSTAEECAKQLKILRCNCIYVFTIAKD